MRFLVLIGILGLIVASTACSRVYIDTQRERGAVRITPDEKMAAEPATAADPAGGVFAVYVEHAGDAADVYLQRLSPDGSTLGDRVRVNDREGTAKAWHGDPPRIVIGSDGTVYVSWTRRYDDANAKGNDLVLSVSKDGGRSFSPAVRVNDDTAPASHGMHSMAVDAKGRIIMAWLDERNVKHQPEMKMEGGSHDMNAEPNSEVFTAYSTDGGRSFSKNARLASEVCPCCKTTVLAAADGNVYVSWRQVLNEDHRHIAVARSADEGESFEQPVMVSNDNWVIHACPVSGAALASTAAGELDVVWYTEGAAGPAGLYAARSTDGGKSFGERRLIDGDAKAGTPTLLQSGAGLTAVFSDKGGNVRTAPVSGNENSTSIPDAGIAASTQTRSGRIVLFTRGEKNGSGIWALAL